MKRILITSLFLFGLFGCPASDAVAQVMLSIENVQVDITNSIQNHSFDIILTHNDPNPLDLTGFQAAVNLVELTPGSPDGIFTSVSAPLVRPYVLSPNSSAPIGQISNGGEDVQIGDFLLSGFAPAPSGSALATIAIEIDGGVQEGDVYGIVFDTAPTSTFWVGSNGNNLLDIETVNGEFVAIPEPSSMPFVALFCVALFSLRRRQCVRPSLV